MSSSRFSLLLCTALWTISVHCGLDRGVQNSEHSDHKHSKAFADAIDGQDGESFDEITPEIGKKRLRILAKKIDTDGDGFVSKNELITFVKNSLEKIDRDESLETFDDNDLDMDGYITWHELEKSLELDKHDIAPGQNAIDEDRNLFKVADVNKDGKLDKDEYFTFKTPEYHPLTSNVLIDDILNKNDKNKDGFIDLNEYLSSKTVQNQNGQDDEHIVTETSRFKEDFDKDGNGLLNRDEIRRWVTPDQLETAQDEAEHLMDEADVDKDGRLSFDEIVNKYDVFTSSEATNYGEDLEKMSHDEL